MQQLVFGVGIVLLIELGAQPIHCRIVIQLGCQQCAHGLAQVCQLHQSVVAGFSKLGFLGPLGIWRQFAPIGFAGNIGKALDQLSVANKVATLRYGRVADLCCQRLDHGRATF